MERLAVRGRRNHVPRGQPSGSSSSRHEVRRPCVARSAQIGDEVASKWIPTPVSEPGAVFILAVQISHPPGGSAIAARRGRLGLTQAEMATLAGCSRASVNLIEGGYMPKRSQVLGRIESTLSDIEAGIAVATSIDPTETEATLASVASEEGDRVITTAPARPAEA